MSSVAFVSWLILFIVMLNLSSVQSKIKGNNRKDKVRKKIGKPRTEWKTLPMVNQHSTTVPVSSKTFSTVTSCEF